MRILQPFLSLYGAWARHAPSVRGRGLVFRVIDVLERGGFAPPVVTARDGTRLELGSDFVTRDVFYTGEWEPEETALLASLTPAGGTFVDVGANVGYFTLLASKWVGPSGKVYAFEPAARTYQRLQRNVALNGATNVRSQPMGCAAAEGSARLVNELDPGHAHLAVNESSAAAQSESIPLTTIDAFVAREGLERVDVIKIDTEGADFEVLKGARDTLMRLRPTVLLEEELVHRFGGSAEAIRAFMAPLGYDCEIMQHRSARDMICRSRPIS